MQAVKDKKVAIDNKVSASALERYFEYLRLKTRVSLELRFAHLMNIYFVDVRELGLRKVYAAKILAM